MKRALLLVYVRLDRGQRALLVNVLYSGNNKMEKKRKAKRHLPKREWTKKEISKRLQVM